jgi:hypothetical protein
MTVGELVYELQQCDQDARVLIPVDREKSALLLGVVNRGDRVYLDPAAGEDDWEVTEL